MTDRPILFSAPMVRALLYGRKTQTRRIIKPQPPEGVVRHCWYDAPNYGFTAEEVPSNIWHTVRLAAVCGDRLYVREHWRTEKAYDDLSPSEMGGEEPVRYLADNVLQTWGFPTAHFEAGRHRQAMHMPRWASRLTMIVTDVRVERLQDIGREDAIAEGATSMPDCAGEALDLPGWSMDWSRVRDEGPWETDIALGSPEAAFLNYFYKINDYPGQYGDDPTLWPNPWVAAYTFTVQQKNIDEVQA